MYAIDLGIGLTSLPILQQPLIGGGPPGFTPNAIHLDGTNDTAVYSGVLTGVQSSKNGIFSTWINMHVGGGSAWYAYYAAFDSVVNQIIQAGFGGGFISLDKVSGTTGAEGFWWPNDDIIGVGSGWVHLLASWNGNSMWIMHNSIHVNTGITLNNTGIHWEGDANHRFFSRDAAGNPGPQMDFAEWYLNTDETLDFSSQANVELFRTADGAPVDLGTDGSTPTGNQPAFYFSRDAAAWNAGSANAGYSDQFEVIGSFTDATSNP